MGTCTIKKLKVVVDNPSLPFFPMELTGEWLGSTNVLSVSVVEKNDGSVSRATLTPAQLDYGFNKLGIFDVSKYIGGKLSITACTTVFDDFFSSMFVSELDEAEIKSKINTWTGGVVFIPNVFTQVGRVYISDTGDDVKTKVIDIPNGAKFLLLSINENVLGSDETIVKLI